jgi:hypothetical protein
MERLQFIEGRIDNMHAALAAVSEFPVAVSECERIQQTWRELRDMAMAHVRNQSRPPSEQRSIGRSSRLSQVSTAPSEMDDVLEPITPPVNKRKSYGRLSVGAPTRGGLLAPGSTSTPPRRSSGSTTSTPRSTSRQSIASTTRSVSGPVTGTPTSRLHESTFASRQRTTSTTSTTSRPPSRLQRSPGQSHKYQRALSPTMSQLSSQTRAESVPRRPRASTSHSNYSPSHKSGKSSWARASRTPALPDTRRVAAPKRKYVANPKNKLDMAVGEVVNKLPVNIEITVAEDSWKDQSGKYWIGEQEPKLCFCRILRSQTVMVRVGGGWTELSK